MGRSWVSWALVVVGCRADYYLLNGVGAFLYLRMHSQQYSQAIVELNTHTHMNLVTLCDYTWVYVNTVVIFDSTIRVLSRNNPRPSPD